MAQTTIRTSSRLAARCGLKLCVLGVAAFLALPAASFMSAQTSPTVEYQLKAAFLYNFSKFVEWPSAAFENDKPRLVLCVFGDNPFGNALDEILQGKTINNREVLARRINELPDLKSCQLVFVSQREDKQLSQILDTLSGTSALVVGESDGFAERGGGIQFYLEDNKLRFAINVDAVQKARLSVSSKLLALARIVHSQRNPKEH